MRQLSWSKQASPVFYLMVYLCLKKSILLVQKFPCDLPGQWWVIVLLKKSFDRLNGRLHLKGCTTEYYSNVMIRKHLFDQ